MIATELTSASDEIDFGALVETLWSYRLLIGVVTAVCTAIAVVLALIAKPVYRAEVVVTEVRESIDGSSSLVGQLGGLASLAGLNIDSEGPGREARAYLQSRRLVEAFIKKHDLLPELYKDASKPPTMWLAVKKFRDGVLQIREDNRKGVTTVAVNWTDPQLAARWANDFIALLNEMLRERAIERAKRNVEYLNEQIAATNVVELKKVMYNLIEAETKTLMLANVRQEYAFEVVDPASPPEIRIRPQRTLMVLFGLVAGLLVGSLMALAHKAYSRRRIAAAA